MSLTRETLMKMNKDILAGMVLDYKERFDSTLSAITDELKELKTTSVSLNLTLLLVEMSTTNLPSSLFWLRENVGQTNNTFVESALKYQEFPSLFRIMN